jgi:hypothetical protein
MRICGKDALIEGKLLRVSRLDAEGYDFIDDPEQALVEIRALKKRIDIFTFIPKLSDAEPKFAYRAELYNIATLPVSTFDNWMKNQIDFKARNKARKAGKSGVDVREVSYTDEFVAGISSIYNETPTRQGRAFWHYQKDIESVRSMNGTFLDRSIFIAAYFEEALIGFVKLVTSEDGSQAGLMQILSMIKHRDKAPTNALVAQAVRSCADRGIPYLWYANFTYGKKQMDGLAEFKKHNGFQKMDVPRYFVPLTMAGRLGLQMGLHRGVKDAIPEPITAVFRRARKYWYTQRYQELGNPSQ